MTHAQKVGVLTFHRCINYGSYWQARCSVEGLRARGLEAVLLDHQSPRVNRAEWRCALQPLLPARATATDRARYAAKARKFFEAFDRLPLSRPFDLDDPADMESVDVAVVGSDEVWNFRHPWYAGYPLFFGDGLKARRVVSYAASFGSHGADDALEASWAERLRRFDALAVRDETSRILVREALGRDPALVLDPCLQFADVCRRPARTPPRDVVVYGHSFPATFGSRVRDWAEGAGLRLVSLGYRNDFAHEQRLDAGPEDFARAMGGALAVVTNFFHGCVFALANARPFVCIPSAYRSNKVLNLTRAVDAEDRLVDEDPAPSALDALLSAPLAPRVVAAIDHMRRRSDAYLDHALA
ncbi:conserved hypothetical protein [Phenylobacterium zucineum HLK1]|uniref:Polysaccharide pyruvyl transferase domain-containing protein n=1 Tax=Phenylobacterium zucineum (strain HLK1) TaxID=450851 RepID=B4RFD8_PHEZH|nr:polysaccharide pyruvyl transferase family protein [Phenylobacterium zucineum]ACG78708.1 conserved hypothetical protein [Phenylobacterium zucineum HLK1]